MGLFSSIFGSKSSSKASIPSWLKGGLTQYSGQIQDYLNSDPKQYVAPASDLQNLAFSQAKNLGSWQTPMNDALAAVKAAGSAAAPQTGAASTAAVNTYQAPQLGNAAQAGAVNLAPVERITGASMLDNFNAYMDPALQSEVDAAMANYDRQSAQARAAQQARQAGLGNWGSGGQFYMSNFDNATNIGGAALEAQLRAQAFRDAMAGASSDADRRQGAAGFNAGASNTRGLQQGQMDLQRGMFNTDALNQFKLTQAGLNADAGQFNAGAANQIGMFNSGQQNNMSMFNTGLQNDALNRALQAAGMQGTIADSMADNSRSDLGMVGTLGAMQHDIDQQYASALPTQLLNAGQMFGPLMGTVGQTTKNTTSPFNIFGAVGSLFS